MTPQLILWGHALAALLSGTLAVTQARHATGGLPRRAFVIALAATAFWGLAVAGIDARDVIAKIAESLRNIAWLAFMFVLVRRDPSVRPNLAVAAVYGIVALLGIVCALLAVVQVAVLPGDASRAISAARIVLRMMAAVSSLVLLHHLYVAVAPPARGGIRLVVVALAAMWGVDAAIFATAYGGAPSWEPLIVVRGMAMAVAVLLLAVAAHRNGDWMLAISRTVAYRSLLTLAIGLYAGLVLLATSVVAAIGGPNVRLIQTALVFGSSAALLTLASTPWLRAWTKVKVAKHLFRHRYDYRAEWQRFTDTLGRPGEGAAPLDGRIVKAVADLTDSPAGLLLAPDGNGLGTGATWNWDRDTLPGSGRDEPLARHLAATARIVELDRVRADPMPTEEGASLPQWLLDREEAWVVVPLIHIDTLVGAIVLARPPVVRALDWEDFDLLRVAGRQAASYLAEDRAHAALADAQRFDEFNRRFAFIMHDIKNLVSQISLVARNAERHADNPEFRTDMIATLRESANRMNALLARLSQHHGGHTGAPVAVEVTELVARIAVGRRAQHPIATGGAASLAMADPVGLEQVLGHLVQNAIEASPPAEPVTVMVSEQGAHVAIDVIDRGTGMSPAFLRDELFRPFASSKPGGFGIGAFEARQLTHMMGGALEVSSREGEGTRFRITLPAAGATPVAIGVAA